jgi:hypothetical protein
MNMPDGACRGDLPLLLWGAWVSLFGVLALSWACLLGIAAS